MLLAEPNFLSRDERERLCQLMFEVWHPAVLSCCERWEARAGRAATRGHTRRPRLAHHQQHPTQAPPALPLPASPQVFNVAGYYGADEAVLSLYALGRLSGTVVDFGYDKIGAGAGCRLGRRRALTSALGVLWHGRRPLARLLPCIQSLFHPAPARYRARD